MEVTNYGQLYPIIICVNEIHVTRGYADTVNHRQLIDRFLVSRFDDADVSDYVMYPFSIGCFIHTEVKRPWLRNYVEDGKKW